jgi:1,4-dihydroxy-2-naphthoyl-CoA synthase
MIDDIAQEGVAAFIEKRSPNWTANQEKGASPA